jgi:TolA-binding protein
MAMPNLLIKTILLMLVVLALAACGGGGGGGLDDRTPPVITLTGDASITLNPGETYTEGGAIAIDNVDGDISSAIQVVGTVDTSTVGLYTVTYNVSDAAGNAAIEVIRSISVQDPDSPVVLTANSITVAATDASGVQSTNTAIQEFLNAASASDAIDGALSVSNNAPTVFPLGFTTVAFTATDSSGNIGEARARVTVTDQTAPVIQLIASGPIAATNASGVAKTDTAMVEFLSGATATDNVDETPNVLNNAPLVLPLGPTTVTFIAIDNSGNRSETQATVSVTDQTAPIIQLVGSNPMTINDGETFIDPGATATDNVDGDISNLIQVSGTVNSAVPETYTLTYSVSDVALNAATQVTRSVIVRDITLPAVVAPANITVAATGASGVAATDGAIAQFLNAATATDNIDGALVVSNNAPAIFPLGSTTVTFSATDTAGNIGRKQATLRVNDQTAPVIQLIGNASMSIDVGGTFADPGSTANDNVDGDISNLIQVTGSVNNTTPGTYTLTYNVSDTAGNAATPVTRNVIVRDITPPVITAPAGITVAAINALGVPATNVAIANFLIAATVTDDVDVGLSISNDGPLDFFPLGTNVVTFSATDSSGNSSQASAAVTVTDQTAPVIQLIGSGPIAATDASGVAKTNPAIAQFLNAANATDNVDGTLNVIDDAPLVFPLGPTTVTFTATDNSNNTSATQATVTVTDQKAPIITLNGAASVSINVGDLFTDLEAIAIDNVDGTISGILGTGAVNTSTPGTYTLIYNVSDAAGNAALEVTRNISVQDAGSPVVQPPDNIVVAATSTSGTAASNSKISLFLNSASAIDDVDGQLAASAVGPPQIFPLGSTQVTFTATDTANNTGQAQATVTVTDQTAPVILLNGSSSISINVGGTFTDSGASASDNVDGDISNLIQVTGAVNTATPGTYTLTYNVSDTSGNAATQVTRSISVQDASSPVVLTANSLAVSATDASGVAATNAAIVQFLNAATATDAIDGALVVSNNAPTSFPLGFTLVTFTATDSSGNTGSAQASVNVSDQTAPVIVLNGSGSVSVNVDGTFTDPGATASDNVDGNINGILGTGAVNTSTPGTYTLTYNVSDAAGNAAAPVTRSISVQDVGSPVVLAPANIIVAAIDASGVPATNTAIAQFLNAATATDAIDGPLSVSNNVPAIFPLGTNIVTFIATDSSLNIGRAQATVTVTDQGAPVIALNGSASVSINVGSTFTDPGAAASDNVDGNISNLIQVTGTVNNTTPGTYTLTYNVSDVAGNAATPVTRNVIVRDLTPPVVVAPANTTVAATDALGVAATDAVITQFLNAATATDTIDGTLVVSNNAPAVFPLSPPTTVTFIATDSSGNSSQASASVTVTDQTAPVIQLIGSGSVSINVGGTFTDPGATAIDNVDGNVSGILGTGAINTAIAGTYTLTYNVSDTAGNAATPVTRSISVLDVTPPVISAPANITVAATSSSGVAATDAAIVQFLSDATATDDVDGVISVSNNGPTVFPLGTNIVTFSATDAAGNTGQAQAMVTVADQAVPVIQLTGNSPMSIDDGAVFIDPGATASDNVDGDISNLIQVTGVVNNTTPGTYTLNYNVSDIAGNAATQVTRSVIVRDITSPVVVAPSNISINVTDSNGLAKTDATIAAFLNSATATDDVDSALQVTNNAPTTFPVGTTTITFSATDNAANIGQASATVTLVLISGDQQAFDTAFAQYDLNNYSSSYALFSSFLVDFPVSSLVDEARLYLGKNSYWLAQYTRAKTELDVVINKPAALALVAEAYYWKGNSDAKLLNFVAATSSYQAVLTTLSTSIFADDAAYEIAKINYYDAMDYAGAESQFTAILTTYGAQATASDNTQYYLAKSIYALGRLSEARAAFNTVITSYPTSIWADNAQIQIGLTWLDQQNYANARSAYQIVITANTADADVAQFRFGQSFFEEAEATLDPVLAAPLYTQAITELEVVTNNIDYPGSGSADIAQYFIFKSYMSQGPDKLALATAAYNNLLANYPTSIFIDNAAYRLARLDYDLAVADGKDPLLFNTAITSFLSVISDTEGSDDVAQYHIARSYHRIADINGTGLTTDYNLARDEYAKVNSTSYPDSIYIDNAAYQLVSIDYDLAVANGLDKTLFTNVITRFQNVITSTEGSDDIAQYYIARSYHEIANIVDLASSPNDYLVARTEYAKVNSTSYPNSAYIDNASYQSAKSYYDEAVYHTSIYAGAITPLTNFTTSFPTSSWIDDGNYYLGHSYRRQAIPDYANALSQYNLVLAYTLSDILHDNAQYYIGYTFHLQRNCAQELIEMQKVVDNYAGSIYETRALTHITDINAVLSGHTCL